MDAIPGENRGLGKEQQPGELRSGAAPGKRRLEAASDEKHLPHEQRPDTVPDSARLAARLREETTELLALLPAARKAAAGGPAGGEAALDGMARAAYRVLRIAENMEACAALSAGAVQAVPICVTALAAAYVNGAAGVCRAAVFRPEWPREPLWSPGCARLFAAALGNLLANAVQYGGERPAVSVRIQKSGAMLLLTVADNGAGYTARPAACPDGNPETAGGLGLAVVRHYAEAFGGQLLINSAPGQGARFTLCLPLCAPGSPETPPTQDVAKMSGETEAPLAPSIPPDYMADRFSPLYVQLAPVCDLPL